MKCQDAINRKMVCSRAWLPDDVGLVLGDTWNLYKEGDSGQVKTRCRRVNHTAKLVSIR